MLFIRWAAWCSHSVFRRCSKSPTYRSRDEWAVIVVTVAHQSIGEMAPEKPNPESVSLTHNALEKTLCSPYIPKTSSPFSWVLFLSCLYGCQWQHTVVSFSQQITCVWTRPEILILAQECVACVLSGVTVCVTTPRRQQSGAECFSSSIWTLVYKLAASHFNLYEY